MASSSRLLSLWKVQFAFCPCRNSRLLTAPIGTSGRVLPLQKVQVAYCPCRKLSRLLPLQEVKSLTAPAGSSSRIALRNEESQH